MKIALLCDYGLDDAIATLYLFKNAEKFEKIDILPIAGNFPLQIAMNNAKRILSQVEELPPNINLVDTSVVPQFEASVSDIHGVDGMGDFLPQEQGYKGEVISYNDWINDVDEEYTVLSLGPCTVTLDILKKRKIGSLIMMGGNIAEPPNFDVYEFNHGMDPTAFAECVKFNHFVATLDTCHCAPCDFNLIDFKDSGLFGKTVKRYIEMSNSRAEKGCYIYDLVATVYLLQPEKFSSEFKTDPFGNRLNVLKYTSQNSII